MEENTGLIQEFETKKSSINKEATTTENTSIFLSALDEEKNQNFGISKTTKSKKKYLKIPVGK